MLNAYPTPHINAVPGDFAPTVLMPGDPLRARFIAETFLQDPRLVNDVRGVQGYTGHYRGRRVSVMASGMGMPSMGIYAYELYQVFGVKNILRIGSAGGIGPTVNVRDLVLGLGASTDSAFARQFHLPGTFAPLCSYELLSACLAEADKRGLACHVGNLLSTDVFYADEATVLPEQKSAVLWRNMGILAVEMETAALYMTAARCQRHALALCTVSDHLFTGESLSAEERQNSFTDMITLALETAVRLADSDREDRSPVSGGN